MPRAVILTALPVEYLAVRAHLADLQEEMHSQGTIYERGRFSTDNQVWEVGIAEVGAGNAGAAIEAERAIAYFKPDVLLFVGIAGGIKDVAIGDVVAATKVYGYESGKVESQFFTRPTVGQSAYALVQRARSEARKGEWLHRLSSNPSSEPRVFVAPIAAGEKVVASKESDLFQFLRLSYNDAVAVEMEGFGFLSAVFAYPNIKAIVIRGISDLIENKNSHTPESGRQPETIRQEKASRHASAFTFELLSKLKENHTQIPFNFSESSFRENTFPDRQKDEYKKTQNQQDLSKLHKFLSTRNWKEADRETMRLFLNLSGKKLEDHISTRDLHNLPLSNLQYIDNLWDNYSKNKFSFTAQAKIWQAIGRRFNHETEIYLGDCLGWRKNSGWKDHAELSFNLKEAPEGHLPGLFLFSQCWRSDLFLLSLLKNFLVQHQL